MAQFDVFRNPDTHSRKRFPLLLDIQAELLDELATRVLVPLAPADDDAVPAITRLMPVLEVDGATFVMHTPELAGVPRRSLGARVGSIAEHRLDIVAALDVLISGV